MGADKKPPMKLVWFELVTDWLSDKPNVEVSRAVMALTAAMVLRATTSQTSEALVSARWIERMTGLNHRKASAALDALESAGWLAWTQRRRNRVKVYALSIPGEDTVSALRPSGDASGDASGDTVSHTPGTPGTPVEEFSKEWRVEGRCSNCLWEVGHDLDCAHRPFASGVLS